MKKLHLSAAIAVTAMAITAAAASDPVLMTINKVPVRLSEFEYLYNKNNSQQLQPQTLDEYVDMFVNYKLKVAAAVAAGMDTTASFRNEFEGYAAELAQARMVDSTVYDSLLHEDFMVGSRELAITGTRRADGRDVPVFRHGNFVDFA